MLEGSLEEEEERWVVTVEVERPVQERSPWLRFLLRSRTSAFWWRFIRSSCSSAVIRPRGWLLGSCRASVGDDRRSKALLGLSWRDGEGGEIHKEIRNRDEMEMREGMDSYWRKEQNKNGKK